ncbi:MAG: hypothetical protein K8S18_01705 [Desulfobacula sp.]|nr:hypothetical protein [Desulfobacula sp.]
MNKFDLINHALDPVRLLKQIQVLQDALWQHVILAKQTSPFNGAASKNVYDLKFQPPICGLSHESSVKVNNEDLIKSGIKKRRQYRKTKKPRVKHWWRTRKDPFENIWSEVCKWLENNPERTATSILLDLQKKYPGEYTKGQLRTLQRRVKIWRKNAIITYDDAVLNEDSIIGTSAWDLKAVTIGTSKEKKEACFTI